MSPILLVSCTDPSQAEDPNMPEYGEATEPPVRDTFDNDAVETEEPEFEAPSELD